MAAYYKVDEPNALRIHMQVAALDDMEPAKDKQPTSRIT